MLTDTGHYTIRPGRASDVDDLARLQAAVQLQAVTGGAPHAGIAAWVEDLLDGHPTVTPDDFLVAEDTATGRPAASLVALRQEWDLAGVRLPVVQVELVGTTPQHRGNRLTERLFAALHQRCDEGGVLVQMIEGIPYFYRRLGYEYALANDGAPSVPATALAAGEGHASVRPAAVTDAEALAKIDLRLTEGTALTCPRDAATWRYEIAGRRPGDLARREVAVLDDGTGVRGYLVHSARLSGAGELVVFAAGCADPGDWPAAARAMLGYAGGRHAAAGEFTGLRLLLDPEHPLARFGPPGVPARQRGWYVRIGDPAGLLGHLLPVLRERWQAAGLRWPEPALTIDLYGRAARLEFTAGELTAVRAVPGVVSPATDPAVHAAVPPGALPQLALGHRTVAQVLDTWPDFLLRDRLTEQFLTAAFPRVPVRVWPRN
ncbi:GNAT family N-acetyltransferase [Actinoplanes sp. NPDC024001]|uniref:GNAT family N-acetyltransferase n=1 Tax=Actinoplanes sp. NPDC024001 TaxID=3154598 RepID=UPI0033FFE61C